MTTEQKEQMVRDNLPFIVFFIKKYFPIYIDYNSPWGVDEDIFQIACIGLFKAIDSYDPSKAAFSTYAGKWIYALIHKDWRYRNAKSRRVEGEGLVYLDEQAFSSGGSNKDITYAETAFLSFEERGFSDVETRIALQKGISCLSTQEKDIVFLRLDGYTQKDIAGILNVTQVHISRLEKSALKKLARSMGADETCVNPKWLKNSKKQVKLAKGKRPVKAIS